MQRRIVGLDLGVATDHTAVIVDQTGSELARRRDWITIARFVDMLPERTIMASIEVIPDGALSRVAALLDDPVRVQYVLGENRDDLAG